MTSLFRHSLLWAGLLILASLLLPAAHTLAMEAGSSGALRFSLVPKKDVDQQISDLGPLLQLLEEGLGRKILIVRPQSYQAVVEGLLSHTIDFAILGPASYASARARDPEIDAFASFTRREGFSTPKGSFYYSLLVALKDSDFSCISALQAGKIALTDPMSTSGVLIPRVEFAQKIGQPLKDFFPSRVFTGSHDRSIRFLAEGRVDAAFVSSVRLDEAVRKGDIKAPQVLILWRSQPIHHDPFVFGGSLGQAMRQRMRRVFFAKSQSLEGMFARMEAEGIVAVSDQDYKPIHELTRLQEAGGE